jgi:hypothetical protein
MRSGRKLVVCLLGGAASVALTWGAATAHTAYLLPSSFAVSKDHASFLSAMTEDVYFSPEFPVRATSYEVTGPDGATSRTESVTMTKDFAVVETPTPANGTYRVSTGEFSARTMKLAKIDGRWLMVRPGGARGGGGGAQRAAAAGGGAGSPAAGGGAGEAARPARPEGPPRSIEESALPAGAEVMETRNVLKSEAYVTKGAPSEGALKPKGEGLELHPLIHPNEIYLDKGFNFAMLLDGKPLGDMHLTVYRGGNTYEDKKIVTDVRTGADGTAKLSFDKPGVYLLTGNYGGRRAEGEAPRPKSYVYSLTFEVLQ